jgi:hypothetical protein
VVNPATLQLSSSASPPILTEGNVQSGIRTFEDAAWVRDEAVRSYAEFHNNIEALHASMRTQLHPVWKTSMQLRPGLLADVRDHFRLSRTDEIPDGVPITPATAQHIAQQEMILDEVEDTLQMLRNTSVRFAAHFLSDEEKISLGANPAYLRAPDIDREVVESRAQSVTAPTTEGTVQLRTRQLHLRSGHSHAQHRHTSEDGLVDSKTKRHGHRESNGVITTTAGVTGGGTGAGTPASSHDGDVITSSTAHRDSNRARHHHRSSRNRHGDGRERRRASTDKTDPLLEELRRQYQQRVKELESSHRRTSPVVRQGTWPQVGSVTSSRSSRTDSS